jgi:DNA (cytosine-5)-methyltransferase 1
LYQKNYGIRPHGNLRDIAADSIPRHDVLCAGFPCQPFSKAGEQLGTKCKLWGDLFSSHVLRVIQRHHPTFLLMENVANLEKHNGGRTWRKMRKQLVKEGYEVDTRILSPHFVGVPQIRERLFIVGSRVGLQHFTWPDREEGEVSIRTVLDKKPKDAKTLTDQATRCLNVWQEFLDLAPPDEQLPSFPIWTMEFGATYPYTKYYSLYRVPLKTLRNYKGCFGQTLNRYWRTDVMERLPA